MRRLKHGLIVVLALIMIAVLAGTCLAKPNSGKGNPGKGKSSVQSVEKGRINNAEVEAVENEADKGEKEENSVAEEDAQEPVIDEEDAQEPVIDKGKKEQKNMIKIEHKARIREKQTLKAQERSRFKIMVNGASLLDQPPVIKEGRVLVPVRALTTAFGASVDYDAETKTVTVVKGETTLVLSLGDLTATVNGEPYELDVSPASINGRTVVPLRFIAEAMGLNVSYDPNTGTVEVDENNEETAEEGAEQNTENEGAVEEEAGEEAGGESTVEETINAEENLSTEVVVP